MASYLVTGGSGFLGGHAALRLASEGHDVFCPSHKHALAPHKNIHIFNGSLLAVTTWEKYLPEAFDAVLHFGAQLPVHDAEAPYMQVNVRGTSDLLHLCTKKCCPRFIYASTLYLAGQNNPIGDDALLQAKHPYYVAKFAAEQLCAAYTKESGAQHVIFRISSPYGENMSPQGIVYKFIDQAIAEQRITVFNRGEKIQNFIYYQDIIDAFVLSLNKGRGTYNLCSRDSVSIVCLAKIIASIADDDIFIEHKLAQHNDDNVRWLPQMQKISEELNFQPRFTLSEGCRATYKWLKQNKGRYCGKTV